MPLPEEDRRLLEKTLTSLSVDEEVIQKIKALLNDNAVVIAGLPKSSVQDNWFGGSYTGGTRLATNAVAASQVVEEEMKNLVDGLRAHRAAITKYAEDFGETDAMLAAGLNTLANTTNCVDLDTATQCTVPEGS